MRLFSFQRGRGEKTRRSREWRKETSGCQGGIAWARRVLRCGLGTGCLRLMRSSAFTMEVSGHRFPLLPVLDAVGAPARLGYGTSAPFLGNCAELITATDHHSLHLAESPQGYKRPTPFLCCWGANPK